MKQILFLLLISFSLSAQIKGVVKDSISGKPIAYVNIWVENENIGTTSEENGTFSLDIKEEKNIVFSALGFETKILKSSEIENVSLVQKIFNLNEITLTSPEKAEVGNYESSGFRYRLNYNYNAIYFEPTDDILNHPYLKEIKFHTRSEIDKAVIRIRIVENNLDNSIGKDIIEESILVEVKKGSNSNKKDVSNLNIKIPENGFYIVFEKLLIAENKNCTETIRKNMYGEKIKLKSCSYEPNLAYIPSEENNVLYSNQGLDWAKKDKIIIEKPKSYEMLLMRKYHDKYLVPSLEITLTN